ncbi:MAG TPA: SRPBCC domain-containing protein [Micromonosporaceae bacterium]
MRLDHDFTVPVPADEAWRVLLDVPRVAPCMPGATLTDSDGDRFAGTVKVKLGPITLSYRGTGHFVDRDESTRRVVIEAHGRESRGSGTAAATVTAVLEPVGDTTRVRVSTDLHVTGRPAQFGRGMIADVSGKLVDQFAACLAQELTGGGAEAVGARAPTQAAVGAPAQAGMDAQAPGAAAGSPPPGAGQPVSPAAPGAAAEVGVAPEPVATAPGPAPTQPTATTGRAAEPIDLLEVTGLRALLREHAPTVALLTAVAVVAWVLGRRSARR